jgi:hypothetical protein
MANRPNLLDLRAHSHNSAVSSSSRPLKSPRMHIAGDVPPELSPLDAFALQSRLLARQLQDTTKDGNRLSRLPPLTSDSPLIMQGRSEYFRSMSADSSDAGESPLQESSGLGLKTELEDAFSEQQRPQSMHPRLGRVPPTPDEEQPPMPQPARDTSRGRQLDQIDESSSLFGARREQSPSLLFSDHQHQQDAPAEKSPRPRDPASTYPGSPLNPAFSETYDKPKQSFEDLGLAPPKSVFPKRSSSIMSSPLVPAEDDISSNMGGSFHSLPPRKLSSGSSAFANPIPSPAVGSFKRSPSVASDSSALPRPSFNFSRPLSRAETPSFDMPSRQASSDSQPSFILADDSVQTPISMHSEAFVDQQQDDGTGAAPSYIYSKFSLPRGKTIQRSEPSENQGVASFKWEQPVIPPSNVELYPAAAPPSPPTRPSSSSARLFADDAASMVSQLPRPSLEVSKRSFDITRLGPTGHPSPSPSRPSNDSYRTSEDVPRGRSRIAPQHSAGDIRGRTPASTGTSDSASTIKLPPTPRSTPLAAGDMSPEEHLAKGIACHENGSVNESTYHLRLAARGNNPTGMLLYALACRHGWGMRPNQKEGVEWLRRAAEYASVEIADDEGQAKEGKHVDVRGMKTHKAQFALSIYELGVSHMNGWGIEQDKSLALRCFEIAGSK